jgi:hypothetical protein
MALGLFAALWGLVHYRDSSVLFGLVIFPPMVLGMLSSASLQMFLGRSRGGCLLVTAGGSMLYLGAFGMSIVVAILRGTTSGEPIPWDLVQLALSFACGLIGCGLGSLALSHYVVTDEEPEEDFGDDEDDTQVDEEIDYTTEPEDLVCLLTNQVINREHDKYVVCHNRLNVSQVCHAVYLKDYVHLLENRCRRCYQSLRERDLQGMRRP